jgi:hypothetical protein
MTILSGRLGAVTTEYESAIVPERARVVITEAAVRAALTYLLDVPTFPDHVYEPGNADAAVISQVEEYNLAHMRKALEAAQEAQLGFLVPELP